MVELRQGINKDAHSYKTWQGARAAIQRVMDGGSCSANSRWFIHAELGAEGLRFYPVIALANQDSHAMLDVVHFKCTAFRN